jgi:hypothetical protein
MTFLEQVRAKRQKLADVLNDDEYSGIREIVEELYPDRAHFIYELLQNAEDAGATQANFDLAADGLLFDHDGRPFTEADIWAITNIGKGSKREQGDQIGRFGVGFKAVFAYCETPSISSPTFSFEISNLVLPTEIQASNNPGKATSFVFPFNSTKKVAAVAYSEIKAGLEELAETTLLFLSHLKCISWKIGKTPSGKVRRIEHTRDHIEIQKTIGGTTSSHYLRFSEPVTNLPKQRITVAYALDYLPNVNAFNPDKPLAEQLRVVPASPGRVAVFFPAEKESSGLRFHLHAPFVPELSRASIKETPANDPLFAQLATLAATSLHDIRKQGLLNADFLGVLPNVQDSLPQRYAPLRAAIIEAMKSQSLTPTNDKSHAPAKHMRQAKAPFKALLDLKDIEYIIDYEEEPPHWAIAASQKNSNVDRFLSSLAITDWGIDDLLAVLKARTSANALRKPDTAFLAWLNAKSLEWHQEFYALLHRELPANAINSLLDDLQIVKLSNGDYSLGSQCFFPADAVEHDIVFPRVAKGVYQSGKSKDVQVDSRKFLQASGVREVGEAEEVEAMLRERYTGTNIKPSIEDLPRWVALVDKDPTKAKLFQQRFILQRDDHKWVQPSQLFLDKPFMETGLSVYYNALTTSDAPGADTVPRPLASTYAECKVPLPTLVAFAKAVGVRTDLASINDLLLILPHIENSVKAGTPDVAAIAFLWGRLCEHGKKDSHLLDVSHQYRKPWGWVGTKYSPSPLCSRLQSLAWVPQETPTGLMFLCPVQASRESLPSGFPFDSGWYWLQTLHFGEESDKKLQEQQRKEKEATFIGFPNAKTHERALRFAALPPDEQEGILAEHETSKGTELPNCDPANPDRRAERVAIQARDAPGRITEKLTRSISVGLANVKDETEQYLRHQYTKPDGDMICQICQRPLPFKFDNGLCYFEKVEFLDLVNRHYQNYLALCPNHSAMFRYVNGSEPSLTAEFRAMKGPHLSVVLAGKKATIYFTNKHIADLRAVIQTDAEAGPGSTAV